MAARRSVSSKLPVRDARRKFLETFKLQCREGGVQFVHGSPRDPTREYVLPRDALDKKKMAEIFAASSIICNISKS